MSCVGGIDVSIDVSISGGRTCRRNRRTPPILTCRSGFTEGGFSRFLCGVVGLHAGPTRSTLKCVSGVRVGMSSCQGEIPTTTKVDRGMSEFVESEVVRLGVSKAEFHRRLLEFYRESRREAVECPTCSETVVFDLRGES